MTRRRRRNVPRDVGHAQPFFPDMLDADCSAPDTPTKPTPPELDGSGLPRNPPRSMLVQVDGFLLLPEHAARLAECRAWQKNPVRPPDKYILENCLGYSADDPDEPDAAASEQTGREKFSNI